MYIDTYRSVYIPKNMRIVHDISPKFCSQEQLERTRILDAHKKSPPFEEEIEPMAGDSV